MIISGINETFKSQYKTYKFEKEDGSIHICRVEYSPAIQEVNYIVDVKIVTKSTDTLHFGKIYFKSTNTDKKIQRIDF